MPPSIPLEPSLEIDGALLERAKLALQSLQYEEQAARYRAAYASLLEAIAVAQSGNEEPLRAWLENRGPAFHPHRDLVDLPLSLLPLDVRDNGVDSPSAKTRRETETSSSNSTSSNSTSSSTSSDSANASHFLPRPRSSHESSGWEMMAESASLRLPFWQMGYRQDPSHGLRKSHASTSSNTIPVLDRTRRRQDSTNESPDPADYVAQTETSRAKEIGSTTHLSTDSTDVDEGQTTSDPTVIRQPELSPAWIAHSLQRRPTDASERRRAWWMAPHIWFSCLVHLAVLAILAICVVTVAPTAQLLSIVAADADSETILTETPVEFPASLESSSDGQPSMPNAIAPDTNVPVIDVGNPLEGIGPSNPWKDMPHGLSTGASKAMGTGNGSMQGAEFFGTKAVGNTFVYVVDSSPSMLRDKAFDEAKREILRSLASMKPKQRYFISFFGKEIDPITFRGRTPETKPIAATRENLSQTIDWIERIDVQKDGRPPIDALRAAIAMQPDGIFLLFDGDTKVKDWTSKIRSMNLSDDFLSDGLPMVPIHVVHFFREEFVADMQKLAKENAGTYRFIPRPAKSNGNPK